jgi:hypothetical protein
MYKKHEHKEKEQNEFKFLIGLNASEEIIHATVLGNCL